MLTSRPVEIFVTFNTAAQTHTELLMYKELTGFLADLSRFFSRFPKKRGELFEKVGRIPHGHAAGTNRGPQASGGVWAPSRRVGTRTCALARLERHGLTLEMVGDLRQTYGDMLVTHQNAWGNGQPGGREVPDRLHPG